MADTENGFLLYQRGETDESDAWDDTALIRAYDEAVSVVKAKLNGSENEETSQVIDQNATKHGRGKKKKNRHKNKPRKKQKWHVGAYCRAVFSEDGYVYNAKIISIDTSHNSCVVQYIEYGNQEEQNIASLLRPTSISEADKVTSASETESLDHDGPVFQPPPPPFQGMMPPPFPPGVTGVFPGMRGERTPRIPSMPPPPPPFCADDNIEDDDEALSCMLISWYMSGYHTGYYQGLKQGKQHSSGKGNCSGVK